MLVAQFDIPVRQINKVPPAFVLWRREGDLHEGPPFRPLWFTNQAHVRFPWKPVALARITRNTRADHVFPSRCSAAITGHDVIEIQIVSIKQLAAVLAGVL